MFSCEVNGIFPEQLQFFISPKFQSYTKFLSHAANPFGVKFHRIVRYVNADVIIVTVAPEGKLLRVIFRSVLVSG